MSDELVQLKTGKPHVSFSEITEYLNCGWRHKLRHIDKIDLGRPSPVLEFGTAIHAACENFITTRTMDNSFAINHIRAAWQRHADVPEFTKIDDWIGKAEAILAEIPGFLDTEFPGWRPYAAEEMLYENIEKHPGIKFKGYIDANIIIKDRRGEDQYWIIDFKTTSWGWKLEKKQDFMTAAQLILYKNFWAQKHSIPLTSIRCGFVLLKKDGKTGSRCELLKVSVGPKTSDRALKLVNDSVNGIKRGMSLKNRNSCTYCEFKDTEHCT